MGWQESRVRLIPQGSEGKLDETKNGPSIISFHNESGDLQSIDCVHQWLQERGFQQSQNVGKNSLVLERQDIEFTLHGVADQLRVITATFTLSRKTRRRYVEWRKVVSQLCEEFDLVLFDVDLMMKTSSESLMQILSKTNSWQMLQVPYDLPEVGPPYTR